MSQKYSQQVYSRTGKRYIFFYISMFIASVLIGSYEWMKFFMVCMRVYILSSKSKKRSWYIDQKPNWIFLFPSPLNYKHCEQASFQLGNRKLKASSVFCLKRYSSKWLSVKVPAANECYIAAIMD